MKTLRLSSGITSLALLGLGLLAAWLFFAALTGARLPVVTEDKAALVVIFTIGFAMCGFGIDRVASTGQWRHPLSILGCLLGALALLFAAAGIFGFALPFIPDARHAMLAVSVIMILKFLLTLLHTLVGKTPG